MKTFEEICKMTQQGVKGYMHSYLVECGYAPISEDGFLYAKGDIPVLLVAHMDTVHKEQCKEINNNNGKLSSPQGIGGDDRCGVFIIMNIINELKCSVLLCEDEESGLVGAAKFTKTDYINNLDVNFMVEFDRKGNNDAVFYTCYNKEFQDFVVDSTGYKFATGSCSDISKLMPASGIAAVNLSCGYYKAHTVDEFVVYDEMMDVVEAARALIKTECNNPFEYKTYTSKYNSEYGYGNSHNYYGNFNYFDRDNNGYEYNFLSGREFESKYSDRDLARLAINENEIELEVVYNYVDEETCEDTEGVATTSGNTKSECWMKFFLENPDVCFNMIVDFNWN